MLRVYVILLLLLLYMQARSVTSKCETLLRFLKSVYVIITLTEGNRRELENLNARIWKYCCSKPCVRFAEEHFLNNGQSYVLNIVHSNDFVFRSFSPDEKPVKSAVMGRGVILQHARYYPYCIVPIISDLTVLIRFTYRSTRDYWALKHRSFFFRTFPHGRGHGGLLAPSPDRQNARCLVLSVITWLRN